MMPMVFLKMALQKLLSLFRAATKLIIISWISHDNTPGHKVNSNFMINKEEEEEDGGEGTADIDQAGIFRSTTGGVAGGHDPPQSIFFDFSANSMLRSTSPFPFFMLVAFEGGSPMRALLLLFSSPFLRLLGPNSDMALKLMAFITFCGLRTRDADLVARAVLPKFYLEDLNFHAYKLLLPLISSSSSSPSPTTTTSRRVIVALTRLPRAMAEGFLRDYLGATHVIAPELLKVVPVKGGTTYFTGFFSSSYSSSSLMEANRNALKELFVGTGEEETFKAYVGIVSPRDHHLFISLCKEAYMVSKLVVGEAAAVVPRDKYPKPLIFHDGRLAFLPTPSATLFLFLWLPIAVPLSVVRVLSGVFLPYWASLVLDCFTGVRLRVINPPPSSSNSSRPGGVLYVCTHRTLVDPVMLGIALSRPVPAVTYSLSRTSELLAPLRTVRLTRDRLRDAETMKRLLRDGDLVVCPEGTTCREPYLLRFSSLFAELSDEIVPVAADARVGMFYGTTASGMKCLDPFFLMMNPRPEYSLEFMGRVPPAMTCGGGGLAAEEVANAIQRQLAGALGFECTGLTRRDKYVMLAGNDGLVSPPPPPPTTTNAEEPCQLINRPSQVN